MNSCDIEPGASPAAVEPVPYLHRGPGGSAIGLLLVCLCVVLLVMDYSDVVFARSGRKAALDLITPGMRLTQAERTLNAAGFSTLYIDGISPALQVSTLNRVPLTAYALHRALPNSAVDVWLRGRLSARTRFYIPGERGGMVKYTGGGKATWVPVMAVAEEPQLE